MLPSLETSAPLPYSTSKQNVYHAFVCGGEFYYLVFSYKETLH